jgi:hypothetical protein
VSRKRRSKRATDAHLGTECTDGQMHTCLHLEAQGWKPDKAALPDPARRAVLKRQKLILEWRLKESAKADVRQTIREEYDEVPEAYDRRIWEDEVERPFQLMFGRYSADAVAREIWPSADMTTRGITGAEARYGRPLGHADAKIEA